METFSGVEMPIHVLDSKQNNRPTEIGTSLSVSNGALHVTGSSISLEMCLTDLFLLVFNYLQLPLVSRWGANLHDS